MHSPRFAKLIKSHELEIHVINSRSHRWLWSVCFCMTTLINIHFKQSTSLSHILVPGYKYNIKHLHIHINLRISINSWITLGSAGYHQPCGAAMTLTIPSMKYHPKYLGATHKHQKKTSLCKSIHMTDISSMAKIYHNSFIRWTY